jgi:hypothetical protein
MAIEVERDQGAEVARLVDVERGLVSESAFNWGSPLASWRKDAEVQRKLGPIRGKVNRSNMNVFPNLFVNSGCWADYMAAADWDDLRANHSRPEGRI